MIRIKETELAVNVSIHFSSLTAENFYEKQWVDCKEPWPRGPGSGLPLEGAGIAAKQVWRDYLNFRVLAEIDIEIGP